MIMTGSFRVIDTWSGVSTDGKQSPRASATLSDAVDGGQLRIIFPLGVVPPEFGMDALVKNIKVKCQNTKLGMMLNYQGLSK
jgi:hypothetical protein